MNGIVKTVFTCPKCMNAMSGDNRPDRCPSPGCNFRFRKPNETLTTEFEWPKSLDEQFFELVQQDMDKFLDKPLEEIFAKLIPGVPVPEELKDVNLSNDARLKIIRQVREKQRDMFIMKSVPTDIEGWFKCMHYVMSLAVPGGNPELVAKVAFWGKEIGKLAESLQEYTKNGGKLYEHKFPTEGRKQ